MNTKALIASLFTVVSVSVFAQATTPASNTNTPRIDKRADNQEKRIDQGVSSGKLTEKEAANLDKRQDKLESDITKAKADGNVTKAERAKLTAEENRNSRKIARKKHNARNAEGAAPAGK